MRKRVEIAGCTLSLIRVEFVKPRCATRLTLLSRKAAFWIKKARVWFDALQLLPLVCSVRVA
jgi:hypothetical protein